jgi:hypothetical protein
MKTCKLIFIALAISFCGCLFAQIPNPGFEDWINQGNYLIPTGWWSANDSVQSGNVYPVNRSTDHFPPNSGSYSIRIENHTELLPSWAAYGIIWTGGLLGNNYPVFPIQGHPLTLYGYHKFLPQGNDTFEIHIRLYNNGQDIGGGQFKTAEMVNSWQPFSLDLSDYTTADSARIMILACYNNDAPDPSGNSVLFIDNLSFDSLIVDGTENINEALDAAVNPNPFNEQVSINVPAGNENMVLTLSDLNGRALLVLTGIKNQQVLDMQKFPPGLYLLSVSSTKGSARKLLVKH